MNGILVPLTLPRWQALFSAILMGATWPLWQPAATVTNPRIPWLGTWCAVPMEVDGIFLALAVFGGLGMVLFSQGSLRFRTAAGMYALGLAGLLVGDQHRLQPWAWQFFLLGLVFASARDSTAAGCARWLAIGIYAHSAFSKFDAAFLESHGQMLLDGLLSPLSLTTRFWSAESRHRAAMMFPLGEFLLALLLMIPAARRWGLWGSIGMHLTLIWTLGFGLRHEWGVLLWNVYFIGQNLRLFSKDPEPDSNGSLTPPGHLGATQWTRGDRFAVLLTGLVTVLPVLENFGWYDHWPAWAVYCPRPERVEVLIDASGVAALPPELSRYLKDPPPLSDSAPFDLDDWSFANRRCPIYPQLRYRLALTLALLDGVVPDTSVTVRIGLTPDRWTGERKHLTLHGLTEVRKYCDRFLANVRPRPRGRDVALVFERPIESAASFNQAERSAEP